DACWRRPRWPPGALYTARKGGQLRREPCPLGDHSPETAAPLALLDGSDAQRRDPEPAGGGEAPPRIEAGAQARARPCGSERGGGHRAPGVVGDGLAGADGRAIRSGRGWRWRTSRRTSGGGWNVTSTPWRQAVRDVRA